MAVESLDGVRVQLGENQQPVVEYLVRWKVWLVENRPYVTQKQCRHAWV